MDTCRKNQRDTLLEKCLASIEFLRDDYIRYELVLQAKRLLVHTDLAVKEISTRLGIEDCAYFSRIFTQATGVSPSAFRQRNLE